MTRWLVRGALLVALAFANLNTIWSPDVIPNALFSWSVLREGDVDYDEFIAMPGGDGIERTTYFFRACRSAPEPFARLQRELPRSRGGPPAPGPRDSVCSIFPPGIAVLALPFFAPIVVAGVAPELRTVVELGHAIAAVIEAVAALLLWSTLRRLAGARWAVTLVLLYWLGTSVRTVASQALWQHAGVHLALSLALWVVLREPAPSRWREFAAGILLGLGGVVRQTGLLVAAGIAAGRREAIGPVLAGTALGVLPLLVFNAVVFGQPLEQGYGTKPFQVTLGQLTQGLSGLLISPSRGLLVYEPYMIAGLIALALSWRGASHIAVRLRGLSVAWFAALLVYAAYAEWWGGRVFGPRFLDDQAPVLFVALGWGIGQGLLRGRLRRALFAIAAGWSLVLFQAAAFVYDQDWDTRPVNVNFAPERLFDWADPQWWAVLRALGEDPARVAIAAGLSALLVALLLRFEGVGRARVPRSSS